MLKKVKFLIIIGAISLVLFIGSLFFKKTTVQEAYNSDDYIFAKSVNESTKENIAFFKKAENGIDFNQELKYCNIFPQRRRKDYFPKIKERAGIAILFDYRGNTKKLYGKEIEKKLPIASLTKMMTAIIVVENYDLDGVVTVSKKSVKTPEETGKLSPGEKISIKGLLHLALMVSSNDAATALAEVMGEEKFVKLMNQKAKEIGMTNTHFENPHGLDEKNHYSTALDLALMTNYSIIHYPEIWQILKKKQEIIKSKDCFGRAITHWPNNTNKLLGEEYVLGGKTGYTDKAGDSMILAMRAPGIVDGNVVLVLLGLGVAERIPRTKNLYDWVKWGWNWGNF